MLPRNKAIIAATAIALMVGAMGLLEIFRPAEERHEGKIVREQAIALAKQGKLADSLELALLVETREQKLTQLPDGTIIVPMISLYPSVLPEVIGILAGNGMAPGVITRIELRKKTTGADRLDGILRSNLALALAKAGNADNVEALATAIANQKLRDRTLMWAGADIAQLVDMETGLRMVELAEDVSERTLLLVIIANEFAKKGDIRKWRAIVERAVRWAGQAPPLQQSSSLLASVIHFVVVGGPDRLGTEMALSLLPRIENKDRRTDLQRDIARRQADDEMLDAALDTAAMIGGDEAAILAIQLTAPGRFVNSEIDKVLNDIAALPGADQRDDLLYELMGDRQKIDQSDAEDLPGYTNLVLRLAEPMEDSSRHDEILLCKATRLARAGDMVLARRLRAEMRDENKSGRFDLLVARWFGDIACAYESDVFIKK